MDRPAAHSMTEQEATVAARILGIIFDYFTSFNYFPHFCRHNHLLRSGHLANGMGQV